MTDTYSADPGLQPPQQLAQLTPPVVRPHIIVRPLRDPPPDAVPEPGGGAPLPRPRPAEAPAPSNPADFLSSAPAAPEKGAGAPGAAPSAPTASPHDFLTSEPPTVPDQPKISQGEALQRGIESGVSLGFAPAIRGVEAVGAATLPQGPQEAAAAVPDWFKTMAEGLTHQQALEHLTRFGAGLGRLGYEHLIGPALGVKPEQYGSP